MSTHEKVTVGEHLKRRRRSLGHNQQRVAGIIGVNQSTVAKWENGTVEPTSDHIVKIAEYLDMRPGEVFDMQALGHTDRSVPHTEDTLSVELSKSHYYALGALASARGTTLDAELERAIATFLKGLR